MSNEKRDKTNDLLIMMAIVAISFYGFMHFYGDSVKTVYLTYKLKQLHLLTWFYPSQDFLDAINYIEANRTKDIVLDGRLNKTLNIVNWIFISPFVLFSLVWGYKVYSKNPTNKFKRILSMKSLKQSEQVLWPYISPMVEVDLMKEPFDKGPYALAMRPYDFAVRYRLLKDERKVDSLDENKAEKLFISQLGKPFTGFDSLKKHEKALFAIFAATGCGDKDGAMNAVNQMAISAAEVGIKKMPDTSSAEPLFKYLEDPRVLEVTKSHAYVYTLLSQMLEFARGTGVFPPSYFIWLKPRDRTLWYSLNCVGRQVSFVEVAGIFAHWKAEQIAEKKLDVPYVTKAVTGLQVALKEVKIV